MKNLYQRLVNCLDNYLDSFTVFMGNLIDPLVKYGSYYYHKNNSIVFEGTETFYFDIDRDWLMNSICEVNSEVSSLLDEDTYEFLGEGYYGRAFKVSGNKVVKITTDINELEMAEHLIKNNYKFFIKVYKIFRVYYNKNLVAAVIIKDYVEDVNHSENRDFWEGVRNYCYKHHEKEDTWDSRTWFVDINYSITELWEYLKFNGVKDKYYSILIDKPLMCEEFNKFKKKFNLRTLDIHQENFGFKNNHFMLFDVSGFKS